MGFPEKKEKSKLICEIVGGFKGTTNISLQLVGKIYDYEYSVVNPITKTMELTSTNLSFCNIVSLKEQTKYSQHRKDSKNIFWLLKVFYFFFH